MRKTVLLSIFSKWANAILNGEKKWEYRRVPPNISAGTRMILYASDDKEIVGEFLVEKLIKAPLNQLIKTTVHETPHNPGEIYSYFSGLKMGSAMRVGKPKRYHKTIPLKQIKENIPNFTPPQSFRYLMDNDPKLKPLLEVLPKKEYEHRQKNLFEFK